MPKFTDILRGAPEVIQKFNPYHDKNGRFTSRGSASRQNLKSKKAHVTASFQRSAARDRIEHLRSQGKPVPKDLIEQARRPRVQGPRTARGQASADAHQRRQATAKRVAAEGTRQAGAAVEKKTRARADEKHARWKSSLERNVAAGTGSNAAKVRQLEAKARAETDPRRKKVINALAQQYRVKHEDEQATAARTLANTREKEQRRVPVDRTASGHYAARQQSLQRINSNPAKAEFSPARRQQKAGLMADRDVRQRNQVERETRERQAAEKRRQRTEKENHLQNKRTQNDLANPGLDRSGDGYNSLRREHLRQIQADPRYRNQSDTAQFHRATLRADRDAREVQANRRAQEQRQAAQTQPAVHDQLRVARVTQNGTNTPAAAGGTAVAAAAPARTRRARNVPNPATDPAHVPTALPVSSATLPRSRPHNPGEGVEPYRAGTDSHRPEFQRTFQREMHRMNIANDMPNASDRERRDRAAERARTQVAAGQAAPERPLTPAQARAQARTNRDRAAAQERNEAASRGVSVTQLRSQRATQAAQEEVRNSMQRSGNYAANAQASAAHARRLAATETDPAKKRRLLQAANAFDRQHRDRAAAERAEARQARVERVQERRAAAEAKKANKKAEAARLAAMTPEARAAEVKARKEAAKAARKATKAMDKDIKDAMARQVSFDDDKAYLAANGVRMTVSKAQWEGVMGKAGPRELLEGLLGKEHIQGAVIEGYGSDSIHVSKSGGKIYGAALESMSREFNKGSHVYHAYLKLANEAQGGGAVKQSFKNALPIYVKAGFKELRVTANISTGGYAWARYGYKAYKPDQRRQTVEYGVDKVSRQVQDRVRAKGAMPEPAKREYESLKRFAAENKDHEDAMHRISSVKTPHLDAWMTDERGGKKFSYGMERMSASKFMFWGSNWSGKMDLSNSAARARTASYVWGSGG